MSYRTHILPLIMTAVMMSALFLALAYCIAPVATHAYATGSSSPEIEIPEEFTSVEHVKRWFLIGLDWLAHTVVWIFKGLGGFIGSVIDLVARIIVFLAKAGISFVTTIMELLRENSQKI